MLEEQSKQSQNADYDQLVVKSQVRRVAVIQRGEAALRFLKTATVMSPKVEAVLLYTHDEMNSSVFWSFKHRQILRGGAEAYEDIALVLRAIKEANCDSAWLGWGFASERSDFVAALEAQGLNVLAPRASSLAELGDKASALIHAQKAGFKLIPSTLIDVCSFIEQHTNTWDGQNIFINDDFIQKLKKHLDHICQQIDLPPSPWLLKATEGGGGRGIFVGDESLVESKALSAWMTEAIISVSHMGLKPRFLLESRIQKPRHIELQLLGDGQGQAMIIGARECSVQRRNQKLIEECPPQNLNSERLNEAKKAGVHLGKNLNYRGVGTVEMLYDSQDEQFYFLEVNPRLQVEHPITEMVYGIDLVEAQINIARGMALPKQPSLRGVAIEARLYAEDHTQDFAPTSGRLVKFRIPSGPGLRTDSGYQEDDMVIGHFDPMLAKVIAHASSRQACILRLKQALNSTQILIEGGASNHHYLKEILCLKDFQASRWHTQRLHQVTASNPILRGVAVLARGIDLYLSTIETSDQRPTKALLLANDLSLQIYRLSPEKFLCIHEQSPKEDKLIGQDSQHKIQWLMVSYRILNDCARTLMINQHAYHVESIAHEEVYWVNGERYQLANQATDSIFAPSKAVVLDILVNEGDRFQAGQTLIKLEAMKVELSITAPRQGRVGLIHCELEQVVDVGDPLLAMAHSLSSDHATDIYIPWSSNELDALKLFHAASCSWDVVPIHLWSEFPKDLTSDQVKQVFNDAKGFIALAKLFDRRSSDRTIVSNDVAMLSAQPIRFIKAYLAGEESSLPPVWLSQFRSCLNDVSQISPHHILLESVDKWAGLRLIRNAPHLSQIGKVLNDILNRIDDIPLAVLDQLGGLDPLRFPSLVGLAAERSARLSQNLSAKNSLLDTINHWLSGKNLSSSDLRRFHPEAAISLLFFYAQQHKPVACKRLLETLIVDQDYRQLNRAKGSDTQKTMANMPNFYLCALSDSLTQLCHELNQSYALNVDRLNNSSHVVDHTIPNFDLCFIYEQKQDVRLTASTLSKFIDKNCKGLQSIKARIWLIDLSRDSIFTDFDQGGELGLEELRDDLDLCIKSLTKAKVSRLFTPKTELIVIGSDSDVHTIEELDKQAFQLNVAHLHYADCDTSNQRIFKELHLWRNLSPKQVKRLNVQRWSRFKYKRCFSHFQASQINQSFPERFGACFKLRAIENPEDIRLVTYAEVYQLNRRRGRPLVLPEVDHAFYISLQLLHQAQRGSKRKLYWNRLIIHILPVIPLGLGVIKRYMTRLVSAAKWLGLEKVIIRAKFIDQSSSSGTTPLMDVSIYQFAEREVSLSAKLSDNSPIMTRTQYESQVVRARKRGLTHPAEVIHLLEGGGSGVPRGYFTLFAYDAQSKAFYPTDAEPIFGVLNQHSQDQDADQNYGVLVGEITTAIHKPKMSLKRIVILCDPTIKLAALGREECDRIIAALRYAHTAGLPVEWLSVSSGAKIDWETGTENLDACAEVLKEIIRFTHAGGMINVLVIGTSVGAQSYWNAEATMMNHCCGTLIMTNRAAMVLTGKKALDLSGCVSATDDLELGGYSSIMGPNGQAQMHAVDLIGAYQKLYTFYRLCYVNADQNRVEKRLSKDPIHRDIGQSIYPEHLAHGFSFVAEVFSEQNQERKKPFAIKPIMSALKDQDDIYLERWGAWEGAETVVVWQSRLGGFACTLIGIENQSIQRLSPSIDGPKQWQGGTLYPQASRKLARAINASRGRYPVIILANLSGFDGSPESLRQGQLEYGSEIAQAVQGFDGPIYFIIMSRYHGGAYVVFSKKLNAQLESIAIKGSYASVIGGGPAASLIFKKDVQKIKQDPSLDLNDREAAKKIADRFDQTHNIQRALRVGSIDKIIQLSSLRESLCDKLAIDYQNHLINKL